MSEDNRNWTSLGTIRDEAIQLALPYEEDLTRPFHLRPLDYSGNFMHPGLETAMEPAASTGEGQRAVIHSDYSGNSSLMKVSAPHAEWQAHEFEDWARPVRPGWVAASEGSVTFSLSSASRWAMEVYFNMCLGCYTINRRNCTCHDEGKGRD